MKSRIIRDVFMVNEGGTSFRDVLIRNDRIEKIAAEINVPYAVEEIPAGGLHLIPGIIDDQVHFREPGLTHKGDIYTESRAAAAGGVTTFMEMPNTIPQTTSRERLEEKFSIAREKSMVNYSFFMGGTNQNLEELLRTDARNVCGIKLFMGSSTGDMLVDDPAALEKIFSQCDILIATHCEDDRLVKQRQQDSIELFGEDIPFFIHPVIRNETVCLNSSSLAVNLARKHNTRLHVLHISTLQELDLFTNKVPLREKRITAEACVHHLWFDDSDYERLGSRIKCNPAIKEAKHKAAILQAILDNRIDIIATDHAPHTLEEKNNRYLQSPSGLPLVQHSLNIMLELHHQGKIELEKIVEKMCHAPADCFQIAERGYIREGYFADLVILDPNTTWTVKKENIRYKCGWSPFEDYTFRGEVRETIVNGKTVYRAGQLMESNAAMRLTFNR
jgi:dihydroorotase